MTINREYFDISPNSLNLMCEDQSGEFVCNFFPKL